MRAFTEERLAEKEGVLLFKSAYFSSHDKNSDTDVMLIHIQC